MGKVRFGGVSREVCFAYVPEAEPGDWVLVHVGFALHRLDEEEAQSIFDALSELEQAQAQEDAEVEARRVGDLSSRDASSRAASSRAASSRAASAGDQAPTP